MPDDSVPGGLRERIARSGEDALGKLAQDLLENPLITGALSRAFEAREKASAAQEVAMGALNIPSAADVERLTRRVRSLSQRLEGIEDAIDRLGDRLATLNATAGLDERLDAIDGRLEELGRGLAATPARGAAPARAKPRASRAAKPRSKPPASPSAAPSRGSGAPSSGRSKPS